MMVAPISSIVTGDVLTIGSPAQAEDTFRLVTGNLAGLVPFSKNLD